MVFGYVLLGSLAAFGALCAGWLLLGLRRGGGTLIYLCRADESAEMVARRMARLRERVYIVGSGASDAERLALLGRYGNIAFCSAEELPALLEQERSEIGTSGDGHFTGKHQRGRFSKF